MSKSLVATFRLKVAIIGLLGLAVAGSAHAQCTPGAPGVITSPAPGSTLPGATVTFSWTAGSCVSSFSLLVGSVFAGADLYSAGTGLTQSATVMLLPTDGRTIYVRLNSNINGAIQFNDYTFVAGTGGGGGGGGGGCSSTPAAATMRSPTPGSTLGGASVTFQWTAGSCVTQYTLAVGNSVGAGDIFSASLGLGLSAVVTNLPTDGRTVFVRLTSTVNGSPLFFDYTYTASTGAGGGGGGGGIGGCGAPAAANLLSPASGSTLTSSSVGFSWTAGSCVTSYTLSVGSSLGASDIYTANQGLNLSAVVNGIPTDGRILFVRLTSLINGSPQSNDYSFRASGSGGGGVGCGAGTLGAIVSPAPGSTLAGASATFSWAAGTCVTSYTLSVGSTLGGTDIYSLGQGTNLSATVNGLPTDGRNLFVRLTSTINGVPQSNDYTYKAFTAVAGGCGTPAPGAITSPVNGATLAGGTVTFQWSAGACVTQYSLMVGNSVGAGDIYSASQGTNLSVTVNNIPTDGRNIFVRLTSTINGNAQSNDYTYKASSTGGAGCGQSLLATMITPPNNATLTSGSVTFTWTAGCNVTAYFLYVGSTPGGFDLYFQSQGTQLSTTVNNLPTDGRTLYVRLWSLFPGSSDIASGWQFNDYSYKAFTNSGACANPAPAAITSPANASTLTSGSATFMWSAGSCVSQYSLSIGSTLGASDIYQAGQGNSLAVTVNGLPTDGRTLYVRLTSTINGSPQSNDYTFKAFTAGAGCGASRLAAMTSPANGTTLTSSSVTFTWAAGCNASTYFLYVGSTPGGFDLYFQGQGTNLSATVNNLPTDGRTLYVRLWSLFGGVSDIANGWQFNDYTYTAFQNGASCGTPAGAAITSPVNGSTLAGSTVTFQWAGAVCATQYTLSVGSTAGGTDIYTATQGTNLSAVVNNMPTDGRNLFVTLKTTTATGGPFTNNYTYKAAPTTVTGCGVKTLAQMITPANMSTFTGPSVTFTWSAGCGALAYFLYVGTTAGAADLYFQNQQLNTSVTVSGLPVDGRQLFVQLWTLFPGGNDINSGWQSVSYTYTAFH